MISEFCRAWEKHNNILREYFKTTPQKAYSSYGEIWRLVLLAIINKDDACRHFNTNAISEIDDGDYQGTILFLTPEETYQPSQSEYISTYVWYGSCSGCDTLLGISEYDDGIPNTQQVEDYMQLALHMLQHAKYIYKDVEVEDGNFVATSSTTTNPI